MIHENTLIPTVWTLYLLRCMHLLSLALRLSHWEAELWLLEYLNLGNSKLFQHHHFRKEKRKARDQTAGRAFPWHDADPCSTPTFHMAIEAGQEDLWPIQIHVVSPEHHQMWSPAPWRHPKQKKKWEKPGQKRWEICSKITVCENLTFYNSLAVSVFFNPLYEDTYELATLKSE